MKQREDKIKCQRGVELSDGEIITRPRAEKNECCRSGECLNNGKPVFDQRQYEQTKIDHEKVTEQKCRTLCDRLVREQVKRREHRDCGQSKRADAKFAVH